MHCVLAQRDKQKLLIEVTQAVNAGLLTAKASYEAAVEAATHSEAKAENDKDTRGLEQSYVARGQAQRVIELETALAALATHAELLVRPILAGQAVRLGALVQCSVQVGTRAPFAITYWLAPAGGGITVADIVVVTPQSPLGRALIGKLVDDEFEFGDGPSAKSYTVQAIA